VLLRFALSPPLGRRRRRSDKIPLEERAKREQRRAGDKK